MSRILKISVYTVKKRPFPSATTRRADGMRKAPGIGHPLLLIADFTKKYSLSQKGILEKG
jgi:hypothetical protein